MEWNELYQSNKKPDMKDIERYVNNSFLMQLCEYIEENYMVEPKIEYSKCSLEPGWNIKYKKSNKSICTIYPKEEKFICMVTVSSKNQLEIEYMLPRCDKYIQEIYKNTSVFNNSRWLMLDVKSKKILEDIEEIISIKMK